MSATKRQLRAVFATSKNGVVTFRVQGRRQGKIQQLNLADVGNVLRGEMLDNVDQLFVLGSAENAALLMKLYAFQQEHKLPRTLYVAGEGIEMLTAHPQNKSPVFAYDFMESIAFAPSTAGWHRFDRFDAAVYEFMAAMREQYRSLPPCGHPLPPQLEELFLKHPLAAAYRFLPEADMNAFARMAYEIVEPRWYYDPHTTTCTTGLRMRVGLGPGAANRMNYFVVAPDQMEKIFRKMYFRFESTVFAWTGAGSVREKQETRGDLVKDPTDFVWHAARQRSEDKTYLTGLLRGATHFLDFVSAVWMDRMSPHRELFVPEYFFADSPATAEAWRKHCELPENRLEV